MKQKFILLIGLILIFGLVSFIFAQEFGSDLEVGCPGRQLAKIEIEYSFSPELTGIQLEVGPSCAPNSSLGFGIRNYQNDDILIYIDGNGVEHEIWPYQSTEEIDYDMSLPYCRQGPGYSQCSHELKCSAAGASITEGYTCYNNQVCCDFGNVDNFNSWYLKSAFKEEDIPQEVGTEWTRELYFKSSPNEKIILSAKNVARVKVVLPTSSKDYTFYYILGAIALIIIFILIILKFRKK